VQTLNFKNSGKAAVRNERNDDDDDDDSNMSDI
jgi:hypothetical protein